MAQLFNQEFVSMCGTAAAYRTGHTLRVWRGDQHGLPSWGLKRGMTKKKKETKTKQESESDYPLIIHYGQCYEEEIHCVIRVPGKMVL